ncbi:MAG: type II secretion system minor pseudopilin GspK [Candidatus Manganitrophaceae bacterium]
MKRDNRFKDERGFALLLSLLVVLLLTVLILEIDDQARADLRAAGNFRDDLNAFYLARSGISAGEAILKEDLRLSNKYDGLDEPWASLLGLEYPLGDGVLSGSIVDEGGKFNLNTLVNNDGGTTGTAVTRQRQLRRLFQLLQVNPDLVDPIVDWIDRDQTPMPFGAEDEIYRSLDPPYSAKNLPFDTLEELRLVRGMTDEVYKKMTPYLTVYMNGAGIINVNTAHWVLFQSLDEGIDESIARRLAGNASNVYDTKGKFIDRLPADVKSRMTTNSTQTWLGIGSNVFSITATGRVQNTVKTIRAVVRRGSPAELLYFRVD